jgi:hypothetical protein
MSDTTLSQAIQEAYASAPIDVIIYHTLEIYHPNFNAPIRVVRGHENLTAGGQVYQAFAFDFTLPSVTPNGAMGLSITIDNVDRLIVQQLELASQSADGIIVTYKAWLSTDLSTPQNNPPLILEVESVSANASTVTAFAVLGNFKNRKFPARIYTDAEFPGLLV